MLVASFLTVLPLVLSGAPPVAPASIDDGTLQDSTTELRVYDVRALVEHQPSTNGGDTYRRLLPLMHVLGKESVEPSGFHSSRDAAERLMDLFTNIGWDDDWSIDLIAGGEIHLDASRDGHERFARLLAVFEAAAFDTTAVIVQRYEGPLTLRSGLLKREVHAAELRSAGRGVTSMGLGLDPRLLATLRDTSTHTTAILVECEIAQKSAVHYARTFEVISGLELELTGAPTRRGIRLGYVLRNTRAGESSDAEAVECTTRLVGQPRGPYIDRSAEWDEPFELRGGGAFGQVTLAPDEVLVFRLSAHGQSADYCAVSIDPTARTNASVEVVEIGDGYVAEVVPAACCLTQELQADGRLFAREFAMLGRESEALTSRSDMEGDSVLGVQLTTDESERYERIVGQLEFAERSEVGASTIIVVKAEDKGVMNRLLDIEGQVAMPRLSIDVTAANGDFPTLQATTVVDGGSPAAIVIGAERLEAQEYDVEVADSASAHRPSVMTRFDGLALALKLHPLGNGRLAYRVRGQLATPTSRELSRANQAAGSGLVATDTDRLSIDDRGVARPTGDGVWRIVLGDRSGAGSSVTLDIRATR